MIQLYHFAISGNSHKVRLMLSLLGLDYQSQLLSLADGTHKSPAHLALNPFGQVPVLVDGDTVVRDSQAILVYLARAYGDAHWFPQDARAAADVVAWLSTAANEIAHGPSALRAHYKTGRQIDEPAATRITAQVLLILEQHLQGREWLVGDSVTVADIAIYPYLGLISEAKIALDDFPHLRRWLARVEQLPGFAAMPGIQLQPKSI